MRATWAYRLESWGVRGMRQLVLATGAALSGFPFLWMVLSSFKTLNEAISITPFFPRRWMWENYVIAWTSANFPRYFFNSTFVAVLTVLGVLFTSSLAAYAFARMNFLGRNVLFVLLLATMMIPFEVIMIPNFVIIRKMPIHIPPVPFFGDRLLGNEARGWYNTYAALIVPWTASVFNIFLLRQFFATIPRDLYDAAVLDGCSHLRFLRSVVLPLSRPALITVALFSFLGSWNALLWPLIVTGEDSMRPLQVGLSFFITEAGPEFNLLMAATTFTILPVVVLYFLAQRYFMEGIMGSGLKG